LTNELIHFDLGRIDYDSALEIQRRLMAIVQAWPARAFLLTAEHAPPVITLGRHANPANVIAPAEKLSLLGVQVRQASRGGDVTYHGPGQLVMYPIMRIDQPAGLRQYIRKLEQAVIRIVGEFGVRAGLAERLTGVWVGDEKIAAIGVAVSRWVAYHGLAINVSTDLSQFDLIVPCGLAGKKVTSIQKITGRAIDVNDVKPTAVRLLADTLGFTSIRKCDVKDINDNDFMESIRRPRLPTWLTRPIPVSPHGAKVQRVLDELNLPSVCTAARCPNRPECYASGTATFLILGRSCTRACRFCAVDQGCPSPLRDDEPMAIAQACRRLGLRHVVITSVTRDDLGDGGAGEFAATIRSVRQAGLGPDARATVEVLVPDFLGRAESIKAVMKAGCDVFGHNIETVARLYTYVRPQADYRRSLDVLSQACLLARGGPGRVLIKSGMMVGLGERDDEVVQVMRDLRQAGCDVLTIGQYLCPSDRQVPVARFVPPAKFDQWKSQALAMGFAFVAAGPFVRSSYQAHEALAVATQFKV
jgi:lipoic acid synthetase